MQDLHRHQPRAARGLLSRNPLLVLAACGALACTSGEVDHGAASVHAPATAAPPAAMPSSGETWDKVKLEDETPLCVFADHDARNDAPFIADVRAQALRANSRVVFGTFPLGCHNEACDAVPTHQCWVDTGPPGTLVVHSRLTFEHKRGSACSENCSPVVAGCETEPLPSGVYTVKYGRRSFRLRVPSVVQAPCFEMR